MVQWFHTKGKERTVTEVKYIVHFSYSCHKHKQTYKKLDKAIERLELEKERGLAFLKEHEHEEGAIPREEWEWCMAHWFYIEKQTVTTEMLDY